MPCSTSSFHWLWLMSAKSALHIAWRCMAHRKPALKLSPAPTVLTISLAGICGTMKSYVPFGVHMKICPAPAVQMNMGQKGVGTASDNGTQTAVLLYHGQQFLLLVDV